MGLYVEILILYVVLFFSGSADLFLGGGGEAEGFSVSAHLFKIFLYYIPSMALIWHLMLKSWRIEYWVIRPGKKDFVPSLLTLPCLLITGVATTLASSYVGAASVKITLYSPSTAAEWVVLCFSCIFAAYLEEGFFRFYLLSKRQDLNIKPSSALILSIALFAICHIYEGPWGFMNAAISAAILGFIFLRYNSLHGIAVAHGAYNIIAYIINAFGGS